MDSLFEKDFTWDNRKHFLYLLPHLSQVKFALFCANQVKHLMEDERSLKALEVTSLFMEGKTTKEECKAADAAAYAAYAAYAADAAAYAAYVAYAAVAVVADVAADAADAADAAAYVAYAAYATAYYATYADLKQDQMTYLRSLVVDSLSFEDEECWLLTTIF